MRYVEVCAQTIRHKDASLVEKIAEELHAGQDTAARESRLPPGGLCQRMVPKVRPFVMTTKSHSTNCGSLPGGSYLVVGTMNKLALLSADTIERLVDGEGSAKVHFVQVGVPPFPDWREAVHARVAISQETGRGSVHEVDNDVSLIDFWESIRAAESEDLKGIVLIDMPPESSAHETFEPAALIGHYDALNSWVAPLELFAVCTSFRSTMGYGHARAVTSEILTALVESRRALNRRTCHLRWAEFRNMAPSCAVLDNRPGAADVSVAAATQVMLDWFSGVRPGDDPHVVVAPKRAMVVAARQLIANDKSAHTLFDHDDVFGNADEEEVGEEALKVVKTHAAPVLASYTPQSIREAIRATLLEVLGFDSAEEEGLTDTTTFASLGMDSLAAINFRNQLSTLFPGVTLFNHLIFDYPNIEKVTEYIVPRIGLVENERAGQLKSAGVEVTAAAEPAKFIQAGDSSGNPPSLGFSVRKLNDIDSGDPIFVLPPMTGTTAPLLALARVTPYPIYGIDFPQQKEELERITSLGQLADACLLEVRKIQPEGPYWLGGYSFGSTVAMYMTEALERDGQRVAGLYMMDPRTVPPFTSSPSANTGLTIWVTLTLNGHKINSDVVEELQQAPDSDASLDILLNSPHFPQNMRAFGANYATSIDAMLPLTYALERDFKKIRAPVIVFRCDRSPAVEDFPAYGELCKAFLDDTLQEDEVSAGNLRKLCTNLHFERVHGNHFNLILQPVVSALARRLCYWKESMSAPTPVALQAPASEVGAGAEPGAPEDPDAAASRASPDPAAAASRASAEEGPVATYGSEDSVPATGLNAMEKKDQISTAPHATPVESVPALLPPSRKKVATALLFPGQGAQFVGMLSQTQHLPAVKAMLACARTILGYDLLDVCLHGPPDRLKQTEFCQPAVFVAGLAALEKLRTESPDIVEHCQAVAGFSIGEITALCACGVLTFRDGLTLVKQRAEAMANASRTGFSGQKMASIEGMPKPALLDLIAQVVASKSEKGSSGDKNSVCCIANELFALGYTVSGTSDVVEVLAERAGKEGKATVTMLPTSGAFHCALMEPAVEPFLAACKDGIHVNPPRCVIYSNATALPYSKHAPQDVRALLGVLAEQMVSPVIYSVG